MSIQNNQEEHTHTTTSASASVSAQTHTHTHTHTHKREQNKPKSYAFTNTHNNSHNRTEGGASTTDTPPFSVAKLISDRFAHAGKRRSGGVALFAKRKNRRPNSTLDALMVKQSNPRTRQFFASNLEMPWRNHGIQAVTTGWNEGWCWDEVKGNWRTFSTKQKRKLQNALRSNSDDFALRDLLKRSSAGPFPLRGKMKRSLSETEITLGKKLSRNAAAARIKKYVHSRLYKKNSSSQDSSEDEQDAQRQRSRTVLNFTEDFEPLTKASATLKASLNDFSHSFHALSSKAKNLENGSREALSSCQEHWEKSLQSYVDSFPKGPFNLEERNSKGTALGRKSNKDDLVIPWSVLPGVLRAWDRAADEWALQLTTKQLSNGKRKRAKVNMSLKDNDNSITIFTTASLPWMTGTAVNPLLRAAYLSRLNKKVTLVVPWLSPNDQSCVYPRNLMFNSPDQQEEYVWKWIKQRVSFEPNFKIKFYPAFYAREKGSLLPIGDITRCVSDRDADIAILEEPEHLNWYHPGRRWTEKFKYVVGVIHTNYLDYVSREEGGKLKSQIVKRMNSLVCRAYCDKVIKLSGAVQPLPKSEICNVHGVSPKFLEDAPANGVDASDSTRGFSKGIYFMGKVLWAKGYSELLHLLSNHKDRCGSTIPLDVYGSGPDMKEITSKANNEQLHINFMGAKDHQDSSFRDYKVFINPSLSDVVATTTAEALAMGKFVIVADHPSNQFFSQFENCMTYRTEEEFSQCVLKALDQEPHPLSNEDRYRLTWEAATERLIEAAEPTRRRNIPGQALDHLCWASHHLLANIEQLRKFAGAGVGTKHAPSDISKLDAERFRGSGFFDRCRARAK